MTKLRNLLRCYAMGMGIRSISSAFHVSRNTVRKYITIKEDVNAFWGFVNKLKNDLSNGKLLFDILKGVSSNGLYELLKCMPKLF